jgi:hypothetical protein
MKRTDCCFSQATAGVTSPKSLSQDRQNFETEN